MDQDMTSAVFSSESETEREDEASGFQIDQLPNEMLFEIFQYLDIITLLSCASVCKRWEQIANDDSFWKYFYSQYICLYLMENRGDVSSTNVIKQEPVGNVKSPEKYWKNKFFTASKKLRCKAIFHPGKVNFHCGVGRVAYNMEEILCNLGAKFQLSLIFKDDGEVIMLETDRFFNPIYGSAMIKWYNSRQTPNFDNVAAIKVYSLTPVVCGRDTKMLRDGPCQKSLLFEEEIDFKGKKTCVRDDCVDAFRTKSGVLIALWKGTTELAFVCMCFHHHLLLKKCLFSSSSKIYSDVHKVVHDDLDKKYGLYGYKFVCQLFSPGRRYFAKIFFGDKTASDVERDEFVVFRYNYTEKSIHVVLQPGFVWEKGFLDNLSMFTITAQDVNSAIIWNASSFVKFEKSESFVDPNSNSVEGLRFLYHDDIGKVEMFFVDTENDAKGKLFALQSASISISLKTVNLWFGTNY